MSTLNIFSIQYQPSERVLCIQHTIQITLTMADEEQPVSPVDEQAPENIEEPAPVPEEEPAPLQEEEQDPATEVVPPPVPDDVEPPTPEPASPIEDSPPAPEEKHPPVTEEAQPATTDDAVLPTPVAKESASPIEEITSALKEKQPPVIKEVEQPVEKEVERPVEKEEPPPMTEEVRPPTPEKVSPPMAREVPPPVMNMQEPPMPSRGKSHMLPMEFFDIPTVQQPLMRNDARSSSAMYSEPSHMTYPGPAMVTFVEPPMGTSSDLSRVVSSGSSSVVSSESSVVSSASSTQRLSKIESMKKQCEGKAQIPLTYWPSILTPQPDEGKKIKSYATFEAKVKYAEKNGKDDKRSVQCILYRTDKGKSEQWQKGAFASLASASNEEKVSGKEVLQAYGNLLVELQQRSAREGAKMVRKNGKVKVKTNSTEPKTKPKGTSKAGR